MQPAKKPLQSKLMLIILAAGLVAFVLYLVFFVDFAQLIDTLSTTNLAIYSVAFAAYMLFTLCSSLVWCSLLGSLAVKVSKRKAFLFTWVGLFFDATVPQLGWSAEVSKTYFISKDQQVEAGKIGASVVGQKLFTMTLTVAALSAGLGLVLFRFSLPLAAAAAIGLVLVLSIAALVAVYYVSIKPSATRTFLNWAIKLALRVRKSWNADGFRSKADVTLDRFHSGIDQLKANPKSLIQPIVYSVVGFVFEVSVMFLTFAALGQPMPVDVVLVVFTLTGTLQSVGMSFFFPELVMTATFTALGVTQPVALSVALLTRVVNLWFRLVVSYGALQWAGIKLLKQSPAATVT